MSIGAILIRADASSSMGAGHVMRCLALAQAWRKAGGEVTFLMASSTPFVSHRVQTEGFEALTINVPPGGPEDAAKTRNSASQRQARWLVLDGYHFNLDYCAAVTSDQWRILRVEDAPGSECPCADVILNQNAHAQSSTYSEHAGVAQLLLGPRFALLRNEFVDACQLRREIPVIATKVLITTGGGDPQILLPRLVEGIECCSSKLEAKIVVGAAPEGNVLGWIARSRSSIELIVGSQDMSRLAAWADIAVSAAGSTCWEFCSLGLPSILIDVAENQRDVAKSLSEREIAVHVPLEEASSRRIAQEIESLIHSQSRREVMARRGRDLVDGRGAHRVTSALRAFGIRFRRATQDDCGLLWNWANDPVARAASFKSAQISWEEHSEWFRKTLADKRSLLLIAEESRTPIAVIRVQEKKPAIGELSINLAPEVRGSGLATHLIQRCGGEAAEELSLIELYALIKEENVVSRRAFENAGYAVIERMQIGGVDAVRYFRSVAPPEFTMEKSPVLASER
ncbi:MAG: pseudaminic acid biosynthesis-associated protein PseG [Acidobacteriaceae bacterium]|nr:pseudaminic acid biosynthesis-associated protein PseG [Acidobacteriaceae bacterium]